MGRRKERQSAKDEDEEDLENDKRASLSVAVSSSDDEEANEDLTLKIEEKAQRMREAKLIQNGCVLDGDGDCGGDVGLQSPEIEMKRNKKKVKKIESGDQSVIAAEEQEISEAIKASETNESPEPEASTVQMSDNIVLRKLLRGPRYFDPPDSNWGTCFNCGEGGHTAANCKAERRKKPCFVCGSLEHAVRNCTKARDCFICKKGGHLAKDCPEKTTGGTKNSVLCLKCGDSGHDMFQCKNSYSSDDLKEIQCYFCKAFGHLCCVESDDGPKQDVSCYRCGQLGHTGLACSRIQEETTGAATPSSCFRCGEAGHFARECTSSGKVLWEETSGAATPSLCFKCGGEGHFARECTSSAKVRKKKRQLLKSLAYRKEKDYFEHGSAPPDIGKAHKRKKIRKDDIVSSTPRKPKRRGDWVNEDLEEFPSKLKERGATTPKKSKRRGGWMYEDPADYASPKSRGKSKHRGGWMTEDSEEFYPRKFNNRWMSPATPPRWRSFNHAGSSGSRGLTNHFQHRSSVSRFGGTSTNPPPRYDWW